MLEVAGLSAEVSVKEGALCDLLRVCVDDGVLNSSCAAKHPHQVIEVIWGYCLIKTDSKLGKRNLCTYVRTSSDDKKFMVDLA